MGIKGSIEKKTVINSLFLLSILFVLIMTLLPIPFIVNANAPGRYNFIPFHNIRGILHGYDVTIYTAIINIIGNIVLFIPFGCMLPWKFTKINNLTTVTFAGFLLSLSIECVQIIIPHRWVDIDDIILNVTGAVVGYGSFCLVNKFQQRNLRKMYTIKWIMCN